MKKKITLLAALSIFLAAGLPFSYKIYRSYQAHKAERILLEEKRQDWLTLEKRIEKRIANFRGSVGVVIKDLDSGWEIAYKDELLFPSASLVKIPIMLSCFYAAYDNRISLKDVISLKARDKVAGSKVLGNLPAGSRLTVEELLEPMITQSDNAAANSLIDFLGFDTLNMYFKKIGLKNTNLARRMMDFQQRRKGEENYTTARDMAFMLEGLYRKQFINKDVSEQCLILLGEQKINDRIPKKLPRSGAFIAHKTGLERHICHDVGIVYTRKGNFLICVLVRHKDRVAAGAKRLIADIALLTYNYYQYQ